jgi:hypothetical protein
MEKRRIGFGDTKISKMRVSLKWRSQNALPLSARNEEKSISFLEEESSPKKYPFAEEEIQRRGKY